MEYTEEQRRNDEQRQYERARKLQLVRHAKSNGQTWSAHHPDRIRERIKNMQQMLAENPKM